MGGITVRPAAVADAEHIARIRTEGWRSAYAGLMDADMLAGLDAAHEVEGWRRRLEPGGRGGRGGMILVAERDGAVAGFVTYGRSIDDDAPPGTGQIWAIYADPDLIGLGVGAALMNAAVEGLAADGLTEATLWVLEGNAVGRRFYAKGGWLPDGASMDQPNGASPPLRDIRLRRRLP